MTGREFLLESVKRTFSEYESENVQRWAVRDDLYKNLDVLSDNTLLMMRQVIEHPEHGGYTAVRLSMLFATGQRRKLERVVRNILLFADIEAEYRESMVIGNHPWKVFHSVETKAREVVCGKDIPVESPEQGIAMRAVFRGVMALISNYLRVTQFETLDAYTSPFVWIEINKASPDAMLEVFAAHPDSAQVLCAYVDACGQASPDVLRQVIETQPALSIGVL